MKIFVADDSDQLRQQIIELLLESQGAEIIGQAKNGHEAFLEICERNPDVVIFDIQMKDGSGLDLLNLLRLRHPVSPAVIRLTNYVFALIAKGAWRRGQIISSIKQPNSARFWSLSKVCLVDKKPVAGWRSSSNAPAEGLAQITA